VLLRLSVACLAAALVAISTPSVLAAQIMRLPSRSAEPGSFLTLGIGLRGQQPVDDGSTGTSWDFGQGLEYRASIENNLRRGTSVGLSYVRSKMPLVYRTSLAAIDAEARLQQLMLTVHGGASKGFHQVFDLSAGMTRYSNFQQKSDGSAIPGASTKDDDFSLALGYGLGYAFSTRSQVTVVQEYQLMLHQNEGLTGNASRSAQANVTRLTVRMGFGSRSPVR
jgi:hypothetical protein